MIKHVISFSLRHPWWVLFAAVVLFTAGLWSVQQNKVDAIPDLSENQVIVFTEWKGRSPQVMEDQVTYPLVTNLQGLPRVRYVRGASMFGMSFIYVIFEDDVEIYWARQRVLERLTTAASRLPEGVTPQLGPDGTGVGHVLWYTLDAPGYDLGQLRAVQDWYVKLALQRVPGVSEIASFGGFEKQYEITVHPLKLRYYGITVADVIRAVRDNNNETGGGRFEASGTGYILRTEGYLKSIREMESIPLRSVAGSPIRVADVATVQMSGAPRLGIFDYNGDGEAVGGIVVMRYQENALEVIERVKKQMEEVSRGLPEGIRFHVVYDRGELIRESVASVQRTLLEEMAVVSLVVLLFLLHWRSAISILIQIPVTIGASFLLLHAFDISSNIMSLTGVALAIGVIVDNGIIMAENAYRHLALRQQQHHEEGRTAPLSSEERREVIEASSNQVSRGVFYSTIIIVVSFLPVFMLTGQEGKLFHPLAWTKTFILAIDAVLVITLAPVLIYVFMRGKFRKEEDNPITRWLEWCYAPILSLCMRWRKTTLALNMVFLLATLPLLVSLGTEFMPALDEQSILFMPVTLPDVSNGEIKRILQVQDKIISSVPEVKEVLGKAGRASTATDNAPVSMIETIILLKPKDQWRPGLTKQDLIKILDEKLQIPGVVNGWTQPIINRINMLSTGVRTDVGIKVYGQRLDSIDAIAHRVRTAVSAVSGIHDLYVEPITGGKYLTVSVRRDQLARYGVSVEEVNTWVETGIGGSQITSTVEGRQRFAVTVRLPQDYRNTIERLEQIPVNTPSLGNVPLSALADLKFEDGPPMITSDNAMLRGAVLFNVRGRDLGSTVEDAMRVLNEKLKLPAGYFVEWTGQYEHLIRGKQTLLLIVPVVLLIIFFSLYFAFGSFREAFLSLVTIPFALMGGAYLVYAYGVHLSVAVAVGFIALFGIAVETGVVMVIYLHDAMRRLVAEKGNSANTISAGDLRHAVMEGAAKRLRPKLMTVSVSLFGLVPVLWSAGVGSDVMLPIVLPMIGGVLTSSTHILLVTPLIFLMTKEYELRKFGKLQIDETTH